MRELWHVVAAKNETTPLYSAAVLIEAHDVTVSPPVAALQVVWDRLMATDIDPHEVTIWHLARRESPEMNG